LECILNVTDSPEDAIIVLIWDFSLWSKPHVQSLLQSIEALDSSVTSPTFFPSTHIWGVAYTIMIYIELADSRVHESGTF